MASLEGELERLQQLLQKANSTSQHTDNSERHEDISPSRNHYTERPDPVSAISQCQPHQDPSNPMANLNYGKFKIGKFSYSRMSMRYSRRYGSYLPYRLGLALSNDLPKKMKTQVDVPRIQTYGWNMSGRHYLTPRNIPKPAILLSEQLARRLMDYYFENINPLFAILHREMFMKQFEAYLLDPGQKMCRLFMAILHALCALSMRFCEISDNEVFEDKLEEKLFDDAYDTFHAFTFEWESVEIVQGYLLLYLYVRSCHRQSSSWSVLGTAIRMVFGLGLMNNLHVRSDATDYEVLKQERVFWACLVMDRLFCVEAGRHFSFKKEDIFLDVPHEFVDDGWQTPISNALLRLCLSLNDLSYDRDLQLDTDIVKGTKNCLREWNDAMHTCGFDSDTELDAFKAFPAAMVGHLRLTYYHSLLFIHMRSVFGLVDLQWTTSQIDQQLYAYCVRGVVAVVTELDKLDQLKTSWWLQLSTMFYAGVVAGLLIYNQVMVTEMGQCLNKIIELLTEISKDGRFYMAKECEWSLKSINHIVYLKMTQARSVLDSAGIDHGPPAINRGHFSSMGKLDEEGNEIIPNAKQDSIVAGSGDSATTTPLNAWPFPGFSPGILSGVANDPLMSIEWFDNWNWDFQTENADFLSSVVPGAGFDLPPQ